MAKRPLISVIIPVHDTEQYLMECLDSVIRQTYDNFELILVDDGSTDAGGRICDDYAARHPETDIRVFHQTCQGQSAARNRGLLEARGTLVAFIDSDDRADPSLLATLYDTKLRAGNADIVACDLTDSKKRQPASGKMPDAESMDAPTAIERMLYQDRLTPSPCGKLFERHLFDKVQFPVGRIYEDLAVMPVIYGQSGRNAYLPYPLYFYRKNLRSTTGAFSMRRLDALRAVDDIERFVARDYPSLLPAARDRKLSACFNMFILLCRNAHGHSPEAERCWQGITALRAESLRNPKVRFKNKAGILLSYLGRPLFQCLIKILP